MAYGGKPLIAQADSVAPAPLLRINRNNALRHIGADPNDRAVRRCRFPPLPSAEIGFPLVWVRTGADGGFQPVKDDRFCRFDAIRRPIRLHITVMPYNMNSIIYSIPFPHPFSFSLKRTTDNEMHRSPPFQRSIVDSNVYPPANGTSHSQNERASGAYCSSRRRIGPPWVMTAT